VACETRRRAGQAIEDRRRQVTAAVKKLEAALGAGTVKVLVGPTGAIAFAGWGAEREDVSDVCAYRTLAAGQSWELRQAIARAEAISGRKVNERAIAAGHHSHDGGKTWGGGH
jgi:hypothetical protein